MDGDSPNREFKKQTDKHDNLLRIHHFFQNQFRIRMQPLLAFLENLSLNSDKVDFLRNQFLNSIVSNFNKSNNVLKMPFSPSIFL